MQLLPFLAVAAVVVVTPGVDMALVTKNALLHGRRPALATAVGINVGILLWTTAAALGLAAVIAHSATTFTVIKVAGALFLVYLGLQVLRTSRVRPRMTAMPVTRAPLDNRAAFRQGLVSNLLNPKIAVFFTSFLPQFVPTHRAGSDLLLLGALFNAMGLFWLLSYALLAARGRKVLGRPSVKRTLDRVSGLVLIGLGIRIAFERRH
jgi:threonine/homoserine/homoserine lactone efflux protein